MTSRHFITVKIPVDVELYSTGYLAFTRVDFCARCDGKTAAEAVKLFREGLRKHVGELERLHNLRVKSSEGSKP